MRRLQKGNNRGENAPEVGVVIFSKCSTATRAKPELWLQRELEPDRNREQRLANDELERTSPRTELLGYF